MVEGAENAPAGPAVYAANHVSALDIPLVLGHLPADFRIIHKRSLTRVPFIGWYLRFGRHIAVDRENPFKAGKILAVAADRLRGGTSVALFPEGTRNRGPGTRRFKRGGFQLAVDAGVPVVPVSIAGVRGFMSAAPWRLKTGQVRMQIHPPISTAHLSDADGERLAAEVRDIIVRALEQSPEEGSAS